MLTITIPGNESFNNVTKEFVYGQPYTIQMEHSLLSIRKWESIYHKPYLSRLKEKKTLVEQLDYFKCMTITKNVPDEVYLRLSRQNIKDIAAYMANPMSAHIMSKQKKGGSSGRPQTAEYFYAAMVELNIPQDCAKWHINQLMALIDEISELREPKKKMSTNEALRQYESIEDHNRKLLEQYKNTH